MTTPYIREPYRDGLDAAWRQGPYEGVKSTPACPERWPEGTPEHEAWWEGFGDGTEDLIAYQRSDP